MLRFAPPDDYGPLDDAVVADRLVRLDRVHDARTPWITSSRRARAGPGDLRALNGVRLCAVGPATEDRLRRYRLKPDLVPADGHPEAVAQALAAAGSLRGRAVLVPRADVGRELVAQELRRAGAEVTDVTAYRTIVAEPEREGEPDIYRLLLDRRIDTVTFTSASAVRTFVRVIGEEQAADLLQQTTVACIGPVTAEAAAQLGIMTTIMPGEYTIPALVEAIVQHSLALNGVTRAR